MKKILTASILFFPMSVFAMSSANYKISADDVGVGGGVGSSTNYKVIDTAGESVTGIGQSSNYKEKSGFLNMTNNSLSLTVDSNTQDLGTVIPGNFAQGQSTLSVTTDSWGGYDLLLAENHALLHTDASTTIADFACAISSPCAWSGNGFGFTVNSGTNVEAKWKTGSVYNYAAAPTSGTIFHTKLGFSASADQTVVGYWVAPSATQKAGAYSNAITFTAVAKL